MAEAVAEHAERRGAGYAIYASIKNWSAGPLDDEQQSTFEKIATVGSALEHVGTGLASAAAARKNAVKGSRKIAASPATFASDKYDDLRAAARNITPKNGRFDVVIHGNKNGVWVKSGTGEEDYKEVTISRLVRFMRKQGYRGGPVRLISCETENRGKR